MISNHSPKSQTIHYSLFTITGGMRKMGRSCFRAVLFLTVLLVCMEGRVLSETVDWKGRDMGGEPSPEWMRSLFESGNEKKCRKQFKVSKKDKIVYGKASGTALDEALAAARLNARNMANDCGVKSINGMMPLCDFWQKDDAGVYSAFIVYTLTFKKGL